MKINTGPQAVDKVYSYTKIYDTACPTQFRPPRPGGIAFPFRKDELGDYHPLKPLYIILLGFGAQPQSVSPKGKMTALAGVTTNHDKPSPWGRWHAVRRDGWGLSRL